jgi:hypothetical protein
MFERRLQRFGGRLYGLDRRLARRFGGAARLLASRPCCLGRLSQSLLVMASRLERLPVLIADLTDLLGEPSEALRLLPCRFIGRVKSLDHVATLLGLTPAVLAGLAHALGVLAALLGALSACFGCLTETLGR